MLSENAIKVLESRYLEKDAAGNIIETPEGLFKRVAHHVAKGEKKWSSAADVKKWENRFFQLMNDLIFLPNSPTLMNAGTSLNQLSACFVLPVEDSILSIFTTLKNMALIQQSGGGTGFNFSNLRASGSFIETTSGNSSGPVGFMKVYNAATQHIKQGGKRRGANMGILNIDHADIEEFISLKREEGVLNNFNISVGITDDFMNCVLNNGIWELKDPATKRTVKKIKAKILWDKITENAWAGGDPGLVFLDTVNAGNPTPEIGRISCTNPCGEVPLLPYEACNLGSINLSKFIDKNNNDIKWDLLSLTIFDSIRFLDNVIEMNSFVIPEIKRMVRGNRKIGLGLMGWAETLILLGIPYESEKAIELAEKLMRFFNEKSKEASNRLAKERGVFDNWKNSIYYQKLKLRNATTLSIAPTGTISIIANTSSSIEPLFALAYKHENVLNAQTLQQINPVFIQYLQKKGLNSDAILKSVLKEGTVANTDLSIKVKNLFKTALEIDPKWHIRHQIAFQKYTDNAVSKTINLPEDSTIKDVSKAYMAAWKGKAKGITVFRTGSRKEQVLNVGIQNQAQCKVCVS